jgi:hypothetical protein
MHTPLKIVITPSSANVPSGVHDVGNRWEMDDYTQYDTHASAASTVWDQAFGARKHSPKDYIVVVYRDLLPVAAATLTTQMGMAPIGIESVGSYPVRKGHGTVLMNGIIQFSKAMYPGGSIYLHMDITPHVNIIASFYREIGFEIADEFMAYTSNGGLAMALISTSDILGVRG